eukprot:265674-Amphidinium_carterae.1
MFLKSVSSSASLSTIYSGYYPGYFHRWTTWVMYFENTAVDPYFEGTVQHGTPPAGQNLKAPRPDH